MIGRIDGRGLDTDLQFPRSHSCGPEAHHMAVTFPRGSQDILRPLHKARVKWYPEAATQSFKMGEVLIKDAASTEVRVKVAADNPTADIVGVAAMDASGVTGKMIGVWQGVEHLQFVVTTFSTDAVDWSDIGTNRALQKHATHTNTWVVDTSDAGNDSVVVEGYRHPAVEGDFAAEAIVHFLPSATIYGGA